MQQQGACTPPQRIASAPQLRRAVGIVPNFADDHQLVTAPLQCMKTFGGVFAERRQECNMCKLTTGAAQLTAACPLRLQCASDPHLLQEALQALSHHLLVVVNRGTVDQPVAHCTGGWSGGAVCTPGKIRSLAVGASLGWVSRSSAVATPSADDSL